MIFLDARFNRYEPVSYLQRMGWIPLPDEADVLGESQWKWLESELAESKEKNEVVLIGSGFQILPVTRSTQESWAVFQHARARLLKTIAESGVNRIALLSGDVHIAEINRIYCAPLRQPLVEITSSGVTHSLQTLTTKMGLGTFFMRPLLWLMPHRINVYPPYFNKNFAHIEMDWVNNRLNVSIHDAMHGSVVLNHVVDFENQNMFSSELWHDGDNSGCHTNWDAIRSHSFLILSAISYIFLFYATLVFLLFRLLQLVRSYGPRVLWDVKGAHKEELDKLREVARKKGLKIPEDVQRKLDKMDREEKKKK
eukprot:TRINITY_DN3066_c0_g2_i1.p1 TRINITY_DN3066_c0_g2~~TRINITY_DN3066_c0_g2_i1.p1  ORF type:complete len:310 (-),score=78.03 TRINITY_DN3066_c0_g2_i1:36-965(-)